MNDDKKAMQVSALCNGTVIDHIPADKLFQIVNILHLETISDQITIGNNLSSSKLGKKGVIKISEKYIDPQELNKIALIAPCARINIIKNYQVVEKNECVIPDEVHDVLQCVNPMCITNKQNVTTHFHIVNKQDRTVKCHYCERYIKAEDLILK